MTDSVAVLGGGGHGRVVVDALTLGGYAVVAVADPGEPGWLEAKGLPHYRDEGGLLGARGADAPALALGVARRPGSDLAERLRQRILAAGGSPFTVLHPAACIAADAVLGEGVQVLAGAVVQTGVRLGAGVVVNTRAVVEHDAQIGSGTQVAPSATILGRVQIGANTFVGAGAIIHQNVVVGDGVVVGMGAIVLEDVPAGCTVYGVWSGD